MIESNLTLFRDGVENKQNNTFVTFEPMPVPQSQYQHYLPDEQNNIGLRFQRQFWVEKAGPQATALCGQND